MNFEEFNALGNAIDSTFGRASTTGVASSFSVKAQIIGQDQLKVTYGCIVNMTTDREAQQMKQRYEEESDAVIKNYITHVKKTYKDALGKALSLKQTRSDVTLEMMNMNIFNRKRTALLRRVVIFDVK
jgi:hypothetical protein